ncbi:hypothetical protein FNV58_01020 (plasmid) [Streptomyces sp. RLB1-9]|uniref:hypothetical protein n=1 Tax=Streptomyces sp. RLB1-9 TaxID=2594454 RepID=UPI0011637E41|nr:hypothetical protein [Streptomyces sp. RLB1-9]QDN94942.1 hypothetical protein FNV58_01020 [Streptomyces sp. RLB1-9]
MKPYTVRTNPMPEPLRAALTSLIRNGARVGPEDTYADEHGHHLIARTDTVEVRAVLALDHYADGVGSADGELRWTVTRDGAPLECARWSAVVALVRNPDVLLPEHIADGDAFLMEVSGDHGETWREFGHFAGMIAREQIATIMREHHGHAEYEPGRLIIRGTLLSGSYSRHTWRFTRTRTAQGE